MEGKGHTGVSAWVTGRGTPSAGCHFLNGVLKCDSLVCVCVCVCVCARVREHACSHTQRMESDLRVFGGKETELSS